jgi:hypothetical protein
MNFLVNHMATMTAMMMQQNNRRHREEEEERRKKRQEESQKSKAITSKAYIPKHAKKEDLTEEDLNLMSI